MAEGETNPHEIRLSFKMEISFVCLCILHQSYLTITAGTVSCPLLGGTGFQSAPPQEGPGVFNCLGMAFTEHRTSIFSMIWTACQPDQIASLYHTWHSKWHPPMVTKGLVSLAPPLQTAPPSCFVSLRTGQVQPWSTTWESCVLTTQPWLADVHVTSRSCLPYTQ